MGWGLRISAVMVALLSLSLGAWPVSLLCFGYLFFSFRKPKRERLYVLKQGDVLTEPGRPWKRYVAGCLLLIVAFLAARSGGVLSPVIFAMAGLAVLSWPAIRMSGTANGVTPVANSVFLRDTLFPLRWHALVELKFGHEGGTRAISSVRGTLFLFAGAKPSVLHLVSTIAFDYRGAERNLMKKLSAESRMLSARGAYLLPLDSVSAAERLSPTLNRVKLDQEGIDAVSALPFDLLVVRTEEGRVIAHGAFNLAEGKGAGTSIPVPDRKPVKQPLIWELAEKIEEKHGWPGPDEQSSFLASLDATRTEPVGDRMRMVGQGSQGIEVEVSGGAKVDLTRPQLRALVSIYG